MVGRPIGQAITLLLALLLTLPLAAWPSTTLAAKPKQALEISFDVRVRDSRIGSGKLLVGPRAGEGRKARRLLQLTGQTESLLGAIYQGALLAHSWVDANWLPQAARWHSQLAGRKAFTQATLVGGRVIAMFEREGRGMIQQDRMVAGVLLDPVALVPWLMQQKAKAGQKWTASLFTGADVCQLDAAAKTVESIQVGGKSIDALRIDVGFSNCRMHRSVTLWLAAVDRSPQRLVLHDRLLGDILFDLAAVEPVPLPEVAAAPKEPLLPTLAGTQAAPAVK